MQGISRGQPDYYRTSPEHTQPIPIVTTNLEVLAMHEMHLPQILKSDRIEVNDTLHPGHSRWSSNGRYQLILQEDRNLVLYEKHHHDRVEPIWASNTYHSHKSSHHCAVLQSDGNFVLYDSHGEAIWSSDTYGRGLSSPYIMVQNDGNVCMYDRNVQGCHWATNTY